MHHGLRSNLTLHVVAQDHTPGPRAHSTATSGSADRENRGPNPGGGRCSLDRHRSPLDRRSAQSRKPKPPGTFASLRNIVGGSHAGSSLRSVKQSPSFGSASFAPPLASAADLETAMGKSAPLSGPGHVCAKRSLQEWGGWLGPQYAARQATRGASERYLECRAALHREPTTAQVRLCVG